MTNNCRHDGALMHILGEEKTVVSFLESVFGFLYRCTDFYQLHDELSSSKIGFPAGVAEQVVRRVFQKYETLAKYEIQAARFSNVATAEREIPAACQEIIIADEGTASHQEQTVVSVESKPTDRSEFYNGDNRGEYRWSQTIRDVDVYVPVPEEIQKAKQVRVEINSLHMKMEKFVNEEWKVLVDGSFPHNVSTEDCLWSLIPGQYMQVNLEKKIERWWDRLFTSDPPINVKSIDTTVLASELSQEEHMKVEELVLGREQRQLDTNKLENIFQTTAPFRKEGTSPTVSCSKAVPDNIQ